MIDWILPLDGTIIDVFAPLLFKSLLRHSDVSDINFHLIDKGQPQVVMEQIDQLLERKTVHRWGQTPDVMNATDVARTCEWGVENCGSEKWCIISHMDIMFKGDWIGAARSKMRDDYGMLGEHCPIMALNRDAYKRNGRYGFTDVAQFFAVPINESGSGTDCKLRFKGDPRITEQSVAIRGFDNGELLELELRTGGWHCDPMIQEAAWFVRHIGGGSTHHVGTTRDRLRWIAENHIKDNGL